MILEQILSIRYRNELSIIVVRWTVFNLRERREMDCGPYLINYGFQSGLYGWGWGAGGLGVTPENCNPSRVFLRRPPGAPDHPLPLPPDFKRISWRRLTYAQYPRVQSLRHYGRSNFRAQWSGSSLSRKS